ncbi:MAG: hypothetical protein M1837_007102 [Sclerophora amabilis]|nr:MAG: hypothetical protein M1837_007102 [Sclerophora amabilis]
MPAAKRSPTPVSSDNKDHKHDRDRKHDRDPTHDENAPESKRLKVAFGGDESHDHHSLSPSVKLDLAVNGGQATNTATDVSEDTQKDDDIVCPPWIKRTKEQIRASRREFCMRFWGQPKPPPPDHDCYKVDFTEEGELVRTDYTNPAAYDYQKWFDSEDEKDS